MFIYQTQKKELYYDKVIAARRELPDDVKALQAELAKVKEELRKEKRRADAYDTMIDIAEDMFRVPIRKKLAPNGRDPACKECQDLSGPGTLQSH